MSQILCVTGTDTGVGKTIATAAMAAALGARGRRVAMVKPTQAGLEAGRGDADVVRHLAGLERTVEGIRLEHPMAPVAAAAREGVALPSLAEQADLVLQVAAEHDVTLVEGAGGLLVDLDARGHTLADLAAALPGSRTVVVCRAALGTLNHTALTLEALERRGLGVAGLVIGAWPAAPDAIESSNRAVLTGGSVPLLGSVPAGAGSLDPTAFRAAAPTWLPGLAAGPTASPAA